MRNEYIPYAEAKNLEELGFNEPCIYVYLDKDTVRQNHGFMSYPKKIYSDAIKAPLYQQAFRWFREKYNLHFITYKNINIDGYDFCQITTDGITNYNVFKTYEEAKLACLKKLIEIAEKE